MFAMAGSHRVSDESMMVVRPLSAIVLGYGLFSLTWQQVRAYRWLFVVGVACVAVAVVQLIPLPATLIYGLPGHGVIADVDRAIGSYGSSHPLSLTPTLTRNALWAMIAPLAVLVLGVQLSTAEQHRLLPLLIVIGIASAALGILQIMDGADSFWYTFQYSDRGLPIGLFANRNHQGVFLAAILPMLAVWARTNAAGRRRDRAMLAVWRQVGAGVLGAGLLLMILLTGSRSAVAIAALACVTVPLVLHRRISRSGQQLAKINPLGKFGRAVPLALVAVTAVLVLAAVWSNRALSIDRLFTSNVGEDMRIQILPMVRSLIAQYWPMGSGLDSFADVFRMDEPASILRQKSMNNAHDDWLEAVMTGGAPAAAILIVITGLWLSRTRLLIRTWRSAKPPYMVRVGFVVFLIYAFASFTDYHLQDGSIACLMVVAALWMIRDPVEEHEALHRISGTVQVAAA
jgi:hypothetical protein